MSKLRIETPEVFLPLLEPKRYKGAWGGRGSGKSHSFGDLAVEDAVRWPGDAGEGLRIVCIREVQKTLQESAKRLIEQKLALYGLGPAQGFKVYKNVIELPRDGLCMFQGMKDHTADSIKSLEGFHRAWVEEGQTLSKISLGMLTPTIRWEDVLRGLESELWFSWNPRRKVDPVDQLFRAQKPDNDTAVVMANWRDNPFFTKVLEKERLKCLREKPDQYDHIWEGGYVTVAEGAYFAKNLAETRAKKRIVKGLEPDPLLTFRAFVDIGGTGAKADNFVIWIAQFVGPKILVLNHYEVQGQEFSFHINWLRENGYKPHNTQVWLPHDGKTNDRVYDVSYESAFKDAGYETTVIPNQGAGAAMQRVEVTRRMFNKIWFDGKKCEGGLQALGWYHPKKDEERQIDLGPDHDWASHSCDSFGLMCIVYDPDNLLDEDDEDDDYDREHGRNESGGY